MEPHVIPPTRLLLPESYRHVEGILRNYDPALRLRRSIDTPSLYVLERRTSRSRPVHTARRDGSDLHLQASEGYIHVSLVHPTFLAHPENILRELKANDSWAQGGAQKVADQMEYDDWWRHEDRRRKRREWFRDLAKDAFPILDRLGARDGTERVRFNSPGVPSPASPDPAPSPAPVDDSPKDHVTAPAVTS